MKHDNQNFYRMQEIAANEDNFIKNLRFLSHFLGIFAQKPHFFDKIIKTCKKVSTGWNIHNTSTYKSFENDILSNICG